MCKILPMVLFILIPSLALAGGDYDEPFSLRLPPAFIRFTEVSTMGGETAANRYSSAINPAALDWVDLPCEHGVVIAPYYSQIRFDQGTKLHITGESLTLDMG